MIIGADADTDSDAGVGTRIDAGVDGANTVADADIETDVNEDARV